MPALCVVMAGEEKDMGPPVLRGTLADWRLLSRSSSLSEESKLSFRAFSATLPPRDVPELMLPALATTKLPKPMTGPLNGGKQARSSIEEQTLSERVDTISYQTKSENMFVVYIVNKDGAADEEDMEADETNDTVTQ